MRNDRRNNENWARPEEERRRIQDMRRMRDEDIRTGRAPNPRAANQRTANGRMSNGRDVRMNDPRMNREAVRTERRGATQRGRSVVGARIIMFLIVFGVLLALSAGIFAAYFFSTPDKIGSDMKFIYNGKSVKVKEETAYRDGKLFVSFTRVADMLSMTRTGDSDEVRFVLTSEDSDAAGTGKEEYVSFEKDSSRAFVTGSEIRLSAECFFSGDDVYIPADFITTYMSGITVTEDRDARKVTVERTATAETDEEGKFIPADAHFLLQAAKAPDRIDIGEAAYDPENVVFTADLSAYEAYMNPADATPYLVLVNREKTVGKDYVPEGLTDVINTRNDRAAQKMVEAAAKSLEALFIELKAAGYTDISVTSGYRSYEYQEQLYSTYVNREKTNDPTITDEEARKRASTYSAMAGTSEHQTGLCCDMHNLPEADVAFAEQEAYSWLKQNAWKFGFIERFPENKTEITGYSYEPWHYRFVGRKAAAEIAGEGLCLEEYIERIS